MTGTEAIAAVRASTQHDSDTQFTDAQLLVRLGLEYQRLRRWLCTYAPALCKSTSIITIAAGASTIAKSSLTNFERLWSAERESGTNYYLLSVAGASLPATSYSALTIEEFPSYFQVRPDLSAPGNYRMIWLAGVSGTVIGATTFDVPGGLEQVLIERAAAWARQRHNDAYTYHLNTAEMLLKEQRPLLQQRYGIMPVSAFIATR